MQRILEIVKGDLKRMEYYVHHVPGRLRVRLPEIRKNTHKAADVERLLNIYGVDHLKVNHLTGSIVVTFDTSATSAEQLLTILQENGLYDNTKAISCDDKIQRASNKAASKFSRAAFGYAVSKALEAGGFPILAALI
jgi:copper chaperone CopZ